MNSGDPHPNTYRLTLKNDIETHTIIAISTGGGMIEVINIDGIEVSIFGDYYVTLVWVKGDAESVSASMQSLSLCDEIVVHQGVNSALIELRSQAKLPPCEIDELNDNHAIVGIKQLSPVLPVMSRPTTVVPFASCADLLKVDAGRDIPLWKHAVAYESARGGINEESVILKMVEIVRVLRKSIAIGITGTTYEDRVLGYQSGNFKKLMDSGDLLNAGALNRIILYVTAMMEVKSSMGVIVAMPTAGACAALPGAVIAMAEEMGLDERDIAQALLASGLIGVFIATAWTFAAEVGGCQAEGGSAAARAAAALVTLAGGTLEHSLTAASMALQSMIGLICDPIANRVEAPCLGKNVMAAANALSCANMALAGFDQVIPLDEVIETAKRVSAQMPRELRCTSLGGLSITPTSLAIEKKLALKRSCGSGGCGCK